MLRQENVRLRSGSASAPVGTTRPAAMEDSSSRDANWRLQQLQTQYDFLVSKTSSQGQAYKSMESQIDDYSQKVRDLRRALEELRHEKDISDTKADRADELDRVVSELRSANRSLEDKISRLCEAPFISEAFGQSESRSRFEDAGSEREEYRAKVSHLQEAVRTHFSALTSLKQHANQLREEKEMAEKKAEDLRLKYQELEVGSSVMQDKLRLFSGDDGVDYESLERALTLVKRRGEALEKLPFLEDPEGEKLVTIPIMKRKLEEVQVMNLKLTEEVERFENMLKLQSGINRDLHKELEAMSHKRDKDKRDLQQRAEDFEELAKKRLNKIQSLEAQVRQLVYGVSKRGDAGLAAPASAKRVEKPESSAMTVISDADNVLLNELIEERGGDLTPDENLLEVWVKSASIADGTTSPGSSSFVVVDFFDYESQTTSLLSTLKPQWDFAATYKVNVDDFLLRYLATDVIIFELNMASQGDFAMLARCTVPLSALLKSKPLIRINNHPMISVRTGEISAHLNVEIRLAIPVSEMYRLFLERHPSERRHIEDKSTRLILDAASALDRAQHAAASVPQHGEDESRLYNELEIAIIKAGTLPLSSDGKAPSAYIHFQFLGHPDKFTNPVPGTQEPTFNERFLFAMVTNDQQLRLLQRSRLLLTVIDMRGEENDDPAEGLLGECSVTLGELAEGHNVSDLFSVKNAEGKKVAELQLSMRWKHTFRKQRELGPRALSGTEVETLISAFAASDVNEGTVDYRSFCRFIDPPHEVRRVMERLRAFSVRSAEKELRAPRDIISVLLDDPRGVDEEAFVQKMALTHIDALPVDFSRLFQFIDMDEDDHVTVDQVLAVLNLDEVAGVPGQLQEKLRERSRDLEARNIWTLRLFEEADQWGANGIVTRMEFKSVLKKMGFQLADEPDAADILEAHIKSLAVNGPGGPIVEDAADVLNDTMGSGDDEVLLHAELDAPERGRAMTNKKELQELAKQQREMFDARSKEALQLRHVAMLESERQKGDENVDPNAHKAKSKPQTVEELGSDPYGAPEHRVAMSSNAGKTSTKDVTELNIRAAKVQSAVRGSQARAERLSVEIPKEISATNGDQVVSSSDILAAEETIRKCLQILQGVHPEPNLLAGFKTVDIKGAGYVSRAQFAHVMSQFDVIQLNHAELRCCMDYFDMSSDGTKIDYAAFSRMCRYRDPEILPVVQKLQGMVLGPDTVYAIRPLDPNGSGYVKRADMMRILAQLGHGNISSNMLLSMLELFETKAEGLVNYGNLVEYVRENKACLELDAVSARFYQVINSQSGVLDEKALRVWYQKIDVQNRGKFGVTELSEFLISQDMHVSREIVAALFAVMEKGQAAVTFSDFCSWARSLPTANRTTAVAYSSLTTAELQKKASAYLLNVAKAASSSSITLDEITASYSIYDWRKPTSGLVGKQAFVKATKRAGFVFTLGEYRALCSEFGDAAGNVAYKKFLSWAAPDVALHSGPTDAKSGTSTASSLIRFLEKKLQAGTDLLSVFSRYDDSGAGRITADEFCAALADLGLSSATHNEALEAADRLNSATGSFVLYRRVVTELLGHIDEVTGAATIDVVETVRAAMQRSKVEMRRLRDLFEYYDRKSTGLIREEDLGTVFEEARVVLKRKEIDAVADRYAGGQAGWFRYSVLLSALESRIGEGSLSSKTTALSESLCTRLRELFEALILRGKNFRMEFDKFDDTFTGSVSQADFREVLQERLRASLPTRDLDSLERVYRDPSDPRRVAFVRMIQDMHPRKLGGRHTSNAAPMGEEEVWEIAESLRQKIRRRCDYASTGELRRPYNHFARKKSEAGVTLDDLALGLRELGIRVAGDQLKSLFDLINLGGGKCFTYSDFVVFVRDPHHSDVVWRLKRLIARAKTSEKEVMTALRDQDTNSSGLITAMQFSKALKNCDVEISEEDVARLMLRFDAEEVQRLDLDKFIRFMRGQPTLPDDARDSSGRSVGLGDEDVETAAWKALKTRVEDKLTAGFSPSEVFSYFDFENRKQLDLAGLQRGAREIACALSRPEARAILRRMVTLSGRPVDKDTFFESLEVSTRSSDRRGRDRDSSERSDRNDDIDAIFARMARRLESQRALRTACQDFCIERPGSATMDELAKVFDQLDLRVTRRDLLAIFDVLDSRLMKFVLLDVVFKRLSPTWEYDGSSNERGSDGRKGDRTNSSNAAATLRRQTDLTQQLVESMVSIQKSDRVGIDELAADFKAADVSRIGELERGEFARVLQKFGFRLSRADERHLVDSLGDGRSGIDYIDFISALQEVVMVGKNSGRTGDLDDTLQRLQRRCLGDVKSGRSLMQELQVYDKRSTGEVLLEDAERAMENIGVPLTRTEARLCARTFPGTKTDTIDIHSFVKAMIAGSAESLGRTTASDATINDLIDRVQKSLELRLGSSSNALVTLKRTFEDMDADGDGKLTESEFIRAMAGLKVRLSLLCG